VVAITAHARPEDREKCLLAGFDAYVPKPLDVNQIIELVAGLTGQHQ
jgi:CheY-like chemotaxis protein